MSVLASVDGRHLLAAVLAGALSAVASVAVAWSRLLVTTGSLGSAGAPLPALVGGTLAATVVFVPFLLAVLLVVAGPTSRSVAGGAALVYVAGLLVALGGALLRGVPAGVDLAVVAVPLARVVALLAVATAVWLAFHGGAERLDAASGDAAGHPLFALVADRRVVPGLSLRRGLVAAGLAGVVGAGGLVAVGAVGALFDALARSAAADAEVVVSGRWVRDAGIPLARLPRRWLFEASFLLAVLCVTGPRLRGRELATGLAVVFGVQSTVFLAPMLVPPFRPVYLLGSPGPILTPLTDATLLVGIAVAVWLARHGGLARLGSLAPVGALAD